MGPELAIGWLISRGTSKFRQPANLALAAPLQSLFPILSHIKVTALMGIIVPPPQVRQMGTDIVDSIEAKKTAMRERNGGSSAVADAADRAGAAATRVGEGVMRIADRLHGPMDKYGASIFLSSKLTSIGVTVGAAACVHYGVDVASAAAFVGMPASFMAEAGGGMSNMAAAVVVNSFLLPGHLWAAVKGSYPVGRAFTEYEKRYYDWVKSMEEKGI